MKTCHRLLLSSTFLFLASPPANAEPVSLLLGSTIIEGLFTVGLGGLVPAVAAITVGNAVLGVLAFGANIALAYGSRPKAPPPEAIKQTIKAAESPEIRAVGRYRTASTKAFGNIKHPNAYRVLLHARGPRSAIEYRYLNGREIIIDGDGNVLTTPWLASITYGEGSVGSGTVTVTSSVVLAEKDGTETPAAWTDLVTDFPDQWTSNHKLAYIDQTLMTIINPGTGHPRFLPLFSGGKDDLNYQSVRRGETIYDPREDSTNGGSGAQRSDDPDTWTWTDNGVLCALHVMRQMPEITDVLIDWSDIADQADAADATVSTKTGSEARARAWGWWGGDQIRGDVLQRFLDSIGGEIVVTSNEKYSIRLIDDVRTANCEIEERDIEALDWSAGPEAVERPNICRVKYYSPERDYELADIDLTGIGWAVVQAEIDIYGERELVVELPYCPSASQAQRIARRLFLMARADAGQVITNQTGMAAWGSRVADIEIIEGAAAETCQIGAPQCSDGDGLVSIPFVVIPALGTWNTSTDEADAPAAIVPVPDDTDLDTPADIASAIAVQYADASYEIRVPYTTVSGASDYIVVMAVLDADGLFDAWEPLISRKTITQHNSAFLAGDYVGDNLLFRVAAKDASTTSPFSDAFEVASLAIDNSAPATPTEVSRTGSYVSGGFITINDSGLNAVRITALSSAHGTIFDGKHRPGQTGFAYSSNGTPFTVTFTLYATDGTAGTALVVNVNT